MSQRHWRCPQCGTRNDRDQNAAANRRLATATRLGPKIALPQAPEPSLPASGPDARLEPSARRNRGWPVPARALPRPLKGTALHLP
ncbi:MAG: hypothetical protein KGZ60_10015 [Truepera sp.]|nr:hypothetical protein [Truepera sp.]